jgi:NADH-quinone oxidoreductase subunit L
LWHRGDQQLIDGFLVNGSAHAVGRFSAIIRHLQSGYLYHYAFAMIAGLAVLLAWVLYAYLPFVR